MGREDKPEVGQVGSAQRPCPDWFGIAKTAPLRKLRVTVPAVPNRREPETAHADREHPPQTPVTSEGVLWGMFFNRSA